MSDSKNFGFKTEVPLPPSSSKEPQYSVKTLKLEKVITLESMIKVIERKVGKPQEIVISNDGKYIFVVDANRIEKFMGVSNVVNLSTSCVHTVILMTIVNDLGAVAPAQPFFYVNDLLADEYSFCIDNVRVKEEDKAGYVWKI